MTWIEKITPWCSCAQYSINMHLRQLPWARTHTTRSRDLITREGHTHRHESPSHKLHNHPYTSKYRYTYIMHNATTQSRKVNQTLSTFQGYGPARYRKCKTNIAIPRECGPSKEQEKGKGGTWRGTLIHALDKRLREREREREREEEEEEEEEEGNHLGGASPLIY